MIMSIQKMCENGYIVSAYFDKKVYLKAETDTFKVNQLFCANTTKAQNSKFKFLFCPLEYGKPRSNVGLFSKFEELFNTAKLNSIILWGII